MWQKDKQSIVFGAETAQYSEDEIRRLIKEEGNKGFNQSLYRQYQKWF
jgi:hypothetical protein